MKTLSTSILALALLAGCTSQEPEVATVTPGTPAAATGGAGAATTATASGTVDAVDAAGGRIVIAHGPVPALGWPEMTMGFQATPEQITSVQPGQKVDFEFTTQGAVSTLTRITPAQ